jgi:hypothetical protein
MAPGHRKKEHMKEDVVFTYSKEGFTGAIYYDLDVRNPREEHDHLGKLLLSKNGPIELDSFETTGNMQEDLKLIKEEYVAEVILPVYIYSHSGTALSTTPLACKWDSCQAGWIVACATDILKEYEVATIDDALRKTAAAVLRTEVEVYGDYLNGDVYEYSIYRGTDTSIPLGSCGGYYGLEVAKAAMVEAVDALAEDALAEEFSLFQAQGLPIPEAV